MADESQAKVDKKIRRVENRINEIYGQARLDIENKIDEFNRGFETRNSIHLQELANGTITQSQYDAWLRGQVFQSEQWAAKRDQICGILDTANQQATTIVNGGTIGAFAEGANWTAYSLEHTAGVNFGFGLYDRATVTRLITDNPQILPEWRIDEPKEYVWNQRLVNNCVTQGIIQGESLDDIATRIATATSNQNRNLALTHARTAMTGAQNAGRVQRLQDAKKMGLKVVKEWLATLDAHTRDSHRDMDGEQRPVGDQWHPMKFSNGCRYPGDPQGPAHEVYNCRCTLTGDLTDFPDVYQRYDNIDGKPVEAMSYREWEKTKTPAKPVEVVNIPAGEQINDILAKYDSYEDFVAGMFDNNDEYNIMEEILMNNNQEEIEAMMKSAKASQIQSETDVQVAQLQNQIDILQSQADKLQQTIENAGADYVFENIWYNKSVTYADWEQVRDSIPSKIEYFIEAENRATRSVFEYMELDSIIGTDPNTLKSARTELMPIFSKIRLNISPNENDISMLRSWGLIDDLEEDLPDLQDMLHESHVSQWMARYDKFDVHIRELNMFQQYGEEYSQMLLEQRGLTTQIANLQREIRDLTHVGPFSADAYSQARRDAALWAQTRREADDALRPLTSRVWQDSSGAERRAAYNYTSGSGSFNRPLRGYDDSWDDFEGIGNVPLDNEGSGTEIRALTDMIERSRLTQDTWLQRGVSTDGLAGFLQIPEDTLYTASQEDLESLLLGRVVSDSAFMSCGSAKGQGFSGNILNVYCPEGTQALYVEPFSAFGGSHVGTHWDGVSAQSSFGGELETILQRNSFFRITKVEKIYGTLYIDIEVVDQRPDDWSPWD